MKSLLIHLALFLSFSIVFSACSNTATTQQGPVYENTPPADAANNSTEQANNSEYPPAPAAVAQADIKLLDGSTVSVEDKKGKVVLLNLWATWCGPCRAEMPELVAMQNEYRDKNLEIIGLNVDEESVEDINAFAEEMKLNYTLAWSDTKLYSALLKLSKFNGIPQSFLIDRNGNLRGVFLGGSKKVVTEMRQTVEKVVNE